jgi:nicotinamide-nucleotide amidase
MRAEILGVGTELLLGQIANTNARWISERLADIGVDVLRHEVVGDNFERIVEAFRDAAARSDVVIATGGLGPTQDDITRPALAAAAGVGLVRQAELEDMLRDRWARSGREMPGSNLLQADVPEGGRVIRPERGTAPGLVVQVGSARVYALPGVPSEMVEMMQGTVLPELSGMAGPAALVSRSIRCVGMAESRIAELLDDQFHGSANPTVAYLAGGGEVKVRLTAKAVTREEAEALIAPVAGEVVRRLGDVVFSTEDEDLEVAVGRLLRKAAATIACAESLTGGELGARITSVPGASAYFLGSAVVYSTKAKRSVLGVSQDTLDGPGVVSRECAAEMAVGARRLFEAGLGVGLTGAAGPQAHGEAEPGLAWVALEGEGVSHQRSIRWPGPRDQVRRWAEQSALDLVRRHLEGKPLPD